MKTFTIALYVLWSVLFYQAALFLGEEKIVQNEQTEPKGLPEAVHRYSER